MRTSLLKSAARSRLAIARSPVEGSPVGALLTSQRTKRLRSTAPTADTESPNLSSDALIGLEGRYVAHNYKPLPVVVARAQGAHVWDPEGKEYLDFLSAYSAVNQGHCHPAIVQAAVEQLSRVTLTSRAFYNDQLPRWAQTVTALFNYDAVLPMNTGAEAVETAVKLARRWGSIVKKVPDGETVILAACGSFHGRTLTAISLSSDEMSSKYHGPLAQGVQLIPYGDVEALRRALKSFEGRAVGFIVEPIQGEGGVLVPPDGYLRECHEACRDHGALLIADEVQTGVARTGRMLASEWDGARPDMVVLGKALGGGVYPISCVLADSAVMGTVTPGVHGSTFGGNPLGCAVSAAALQVIADEALVQRAAKLGEQFEAATQPLVSTASKRRLVLEQRGRGLLRARQPRHADSFAEPHSSPPALTLFHAFLILRTQALFCQTNTLDSVPPHFTTHKTYT